MISKKNRLKQREVKKVLNRWKPFFSYSIVLNYLKNNLSKNRFAIVISSKSINNNVSRNYFRRKYYDIIKNNNFLNEKNNFLNEKNNWFDYVFLIKKREKLDKKDEKSIKNFERDINFLLNKF